MIKLITATPGSGKTLFAMQMMFDYLNKPHDPDQPIRQIYSNIDGLKVPGVLNMPDDWRDTPDGSIIFIDEAQMMPAYTKREDKWVENHLKKQYAEIKQQLQIHRHTGHDIIFITQFPRLLSTDVIDLVGEHYHLHRPFGMPASKVYLWRYAQANPNTRSAKSDAESSHIFKFPKYLYNYYKSATIHTHKTKIPTKYLLFILIPIGLFAWSAYSLYHSPFSPHKPAEQVKPKGSLFGETTVHNLPNQPIQQPTPQQTPAIQAPSYDPLTRVAFVVSTDNNCIAKNQYGEVLNMPVYKCYLYAESPSMLSMPRERDDTPDRRDSQTEPAKPPAPLQQVVRPQTVDYQTAAGVDVAQTTVTQQTNI